MTSTPRTTARRPVGVLLAAALALLATVGLPSAAGAEESDEQDAQDTQDTLGIQGGDGTLKYVALGDSFTSGPFIPTATGPLLCGRSDNNYPHLVAKQYKLREFVDVSCAGATIDDMFLARGSDTHIVSHDGVITSDTGHTLPTLGGGGNITGAIPAQLDALTLDTDIVTLGVGADSMSFGELAVTCAAVGVWPWGDTCKRLHNFNGDEIQRRLDATEAKFRKLLVEIDKRAPNANIFIVGYPAVLPDDGAGCWPWLPLENGDLVWLRDALRRLDDMIFATASSVDVIAKGTQITSVDLYEDSVGHDACKRSGVKWYEAAIPNSLAAPLHPNKLGMEYAARQVLAAFG